MTLSIGGNDISLLADDVEVIKNEKDGYAVESNGGLTVALTTSLTDDLIDEGFAREIVNKIQNMRKSSGFEVTDIISVKVQSTERVSLAAKKYDAFIKKETLAQSVEFSQSETPEGATEWNINGEKTSIALSKI
ncbi:MAG: hypothetical protein IH931_02605 [candidate division Zixibacteria bacterium]|nr:hypothetical protein [candidate division Zixibacteria bacterium]